MIRNCFFVFRSRRLLAAAALTLLAFSGCQKSDLPSTSPASGRVVYTDGRPLNGGTIEFVPSPPDPLITVTGAIDKDGRFKLNTIKGNSKVSGAVQGQYQVTIVPPFIDRNHPQTPVTLPGAYTVKAGENVFPDFKIRPQSSAAAPPR